MKLRFTKMQGTGNDFVVLDATESPLELSAEQFRRLGDRRFGIGCDQILMVEKAASPDVDFRYRIFNNSGEEVEQCGNGARCFARYVRDKGLSQCDTLVVETMNTRLQLRLGSDGRVTVDMGAPVFDLDRVPFDCAGLTPRLAGRMQLWPIDAGEAQLEVAVLSMGNPHAVALTDDVDNAPVGLLGPLVERHSRFPNRVNVGFLQPIDRRSAWLRVHERGAGETLACGTGACAAVVAGIELGLFDPQVEVETRGGRLTIAWEGGSSPVSMTGSAETVFEGEIEL